MVVLGILAVSLEFVVHYQGFKMNVYLQAQVLGSMDLPIFITLLPFKTMEEVVPLNFWLALFYLQEQLGFFYG
jgi:hypothetical protein